MFTFFPFLSFPAPTTAFSDCFPLSCPSFSNMHFFSFQNSHLKLTLIKYLNQKKKCGDIHIYTLSFPLLLLLVVNLSVTLNQNQVFISLPSFLPHPNTSTHTLPSLIVISTFSPFSPNFPSLSSSPGAPFDLPYFQYTPLT